MDLPEPYHSLPFHRWRKMMRALPQSYATAGARHWLQTRRKIRLRHEMDTAKPVREAVPLTAEELEALHRNKEESIKIILQYLRSREERGGGTLEERGDV